ncbi:hypothetical protein [Acinetobacter stercoris]|uniref:Uncharacterized protein n=1 Tax=Acinetobacter stercoris TaxID=2126983 RepID=A0A2U3MUN5_9GAMM|nr:hypothetical protein [Acinetobacter stercoris]SPL69147.1 hypothetical protein KPC_0325 [Acinetobacter stercoris]
MKIKIEESEQAKIPSQLIKYKDGAKFLIAGIDKPSFRHCMELRGTRIEQEIQGVRDITDETSLNVAQSFGKAVSHLILNWEGIENEKGEIFEYSKQNAELLCTSTKESIELIVWVLTEAQKIQDEANQEKAEILGKSSSSISTKTKDTVQKKPKRSTKT